MLFMFAVTTSALALDYTSWLSKDKVIRLQNLLSPGELESLMAQIYVFHRQAYSYDKKEMFLDVACKLIARYEAGLFNLRELIRLSVQVFDLLYAHPDYSPDLMAKEVDRAFA